MGKGREKRKRRAKKVEKADQKNGLTMVKKAHVKKAKVSHKPVGFKVSHKVGFKAHKPATE